MSIVVIGAVFVDIKGYPTQTYIPAGRNQGRVEQVHGGVGRNICEDVANVELRPIFLTMVDESGISDDVIRKLRNHKVNTDYIRRDPDGLGTWLAIFDNDGDVVASISKRPSLSGIEQILMEQGDEIFSQADSILFEVDLEREVLKQIYTLAERYNVPLFAVVSNMSIAVQRRDLLQKTACVVCNKQEAGILFSENYDAMDASELEPILVQKIGSAHIPRMVVTMGSEGSVYADIDGNSGIVPAKRTRVADTTGAGDAFFSGVAIGLTYHKSLEESCEIGTRLAASVIETTENVCPRFLPSEFGINPAGGHSDGED